MIDQLSEYFRFMRDMGELEVPLPVEKIKLFKKAHPSHSNIENDSKSKSESIEQLIEVARNCKKCELYKTRNKLVFGCGSLDSEIIFIGEAPGRQEDLYGIPFIGQAGKLLDKILEAVKLQRENVYIANILKDRPPNNRDPKIEEEHACLPFLIKQIQIIKPKIICCLGRVSAKALLKTNYSMKEMRGKIYSYQSIPLIVTYHPAALLRNAKLKRPTWDDFQFLLRTLDEIRCKNNNP